jgi:hypothetical protein
MPVKRMHPRSASAGGRPLQGDEAVELYAAEIARKIAALSQQADLLRAKIAESGQLLDAIGRKN